MHVDAELESLGLEHKQKLACQREALAALPIDWSTCVAEVREGWVKNLLPQRRDASGVA